MKCRVLGLIALCVGWTAAAADATLVLEYQLKGYPTTKDTCHQAALDAGAKFAAATQLPVVDARCLAEAPSGFDLMIRYEATKQVAVVSTDYRYSSVYPAGRYADAAACEKELAGKVDEFELHTGLEATFAYCYLPKYAGSRIPWVVRIDGFGTAKLAPLVSGYHMFSQAKNLTKTQFHDGIRSALTRQGAVFSDAVIHSSIGMAQVVVHYYAEKSIGFELVELTKTDKLEQCEAQLDELQGAYATTGNPAALAYCGYVHVGGATEGTLLFAGSPELSNRLSVETYPSFAECEAKRPALVEFYKTKLKADVRGSACTRRGNAFPILLIEG